MSNFTDYLDNNKINIYTNDYDDVVIDVKDPGGVLLKPAEVNEIIAALRAAIGGEQMMLFREGPGE